MGTPKNLVESSRDMVQDQLVPELKALKTSQDAVHSEIGYLRAEVKKSIDALRTEIKLRGEIHARAIHSLEEKLDFTIEFRERLASLEAHSPRQ